MSRHGGANAIYGAHLFGVGALTANRFPAHEFQSEVEQIVVEKLTEMCLARFKWRGLPDSVSERYLEQSLFYTGACYFYANEKYGWLALRGSGGGLDMYGNPTTFNIMGAPLVNDVNVPAERVDPIYNNSLRRGDFRTVLMYARRLATMDVTINVNTQNARQPRILAADENTRLSMENISRQVDQGVPVIKVDRKLDPSANITALDMGVDPDIFDKLGIARTRVFNEAMSVLGIANANQDKKERLVVDEVNANDEQVVVMRAVSLNARQEAARLISKRLGREVSVSYDPDTTTSNERGVNDGIDNDDTSASAGI